MHIRPFIISTTAIAIGKGDGSTVTSCPVSLWEAREALFPLPIYAVSTIDIVSRSQDVSTPIVHTTPPTSWAYKGVCSTTIFGGPL